MDYGPSCGSEKLRARLANLYSVKASAPLSAENVLITPGASLANFLIFYGLCDRGDHVICQYPTYQQLYTQPASLGAEVSLWKTKGEDNWRLDIEELNGMIKANTKFIVIKYVKSPVLVRILLFLSQANAFVVIKKKKQPAKPHRRHNPTLNARIHRRNRARTLHNHHQR